MQSHKHNKTKQGQAVNAARTDFACKLFKHFAPTNGRRTTPVDALRRALQRLPGPDCRDRHGNGHLQHEAQKNNHAGRTGPNAPLPHTLCPEASPAHYTYVQPHALNAHTLNAHTTTRTERMLQVTLCDFFGNILLHTYAKQQNQILSLNTRFSGIRPEHLVDAPSFSTVRRWVCEIVANRPLCGHSVRNDLNALKMEHPANLLIDTQRLPC
eukprot:559269-Rhodomonas_salina.1